MHEGTILLIDDDQSVVHLLRRALERAGWRVLVASNASESESVLRSESLELVVADIYLPDGNGVELVRRFRAQGSDVPIVLITGQPRLDTSMEAIRLGISGYLAKPVDVEDLLTLVVKAVRDYRLRGLEAEAAALAMRPRPRTVATESLREDVGRAVVDDALTSLHLAWQPLIDLDTGNVIALEALARTRHQTLGLPLALLSAAGAVGLIHEVDREVRSLVASFIESSSSLDAAPLIFVNLHPDDFLDPDLSSPDSPLTAHADRIVFDISERSNLVSIDDLRDRVEELKSMGFRFAIDDFGTGYAGLSSFTMIDATIVKLDRALVSGIDLEKAKQGLVSSVSQLCDSLGVTLVVKGIETEAELSAVRRTGARVAQGFHLARPVLDVAGEVRLPFDRWPAVAR